MRVLGIDPGTAIVGYGIVDYDGRNFKVVDYGCIYTDKDESQEKRIEKIYDEIDDIIKKYKPDTMGVEELFFFKNNKTVITVGQARGVILLCGRKNRIGISGYTPLQVKMGITGYGRADKQQIQKMVMSILKLEEIPKPDDAADALAIAVTHTHAIMSQVKDVKKESMEVSKKPGKIKGKMTLEEYKALIKKR